MLAHPTPSQYAQNMPPRSLERFRLTPPPLSGQCEEFLDIRYQQLMDEVASGAARTENFYEIYEAYVKQSRGELDTDITFAVTLAWDVRDILFEKQEEIELKLSDTEIRRRNLLVKTMKKGDHIMHWAIHNNTSSLIEPDKPYSPKLVAALGADAVKQICGISSTRDFNLTLWAISVPPSVENQIKQARKQS